MMWNYLITHQYYSAPESRRLYVFKFQTCVFLFSQRFTEFSINLCKGSFSHRASHLSESLFSVILCYSESRYEITNTCKRRVLLMVHAILANIWWSRMKHFYMIYTVAQFSYELLVKLLRVNLKHPVAAPHCSKAVKMRYQFSFCTVSI